MAAGSPSFGQLVRHHRRAVGLTQEQLAERAQLSVEAIGALERATRRRPRADTVAQLGVALELSERQQDELAGTVDRSQATLIEAEHVPRYAAPRQLPPALADFTGREADVAALCAALADGAAGASLAPTVCVVTGMGGAGKTALAIQVGHLITERFPDGQLYLNARGYGPGEAVSRLRAFEALLRGLGVPEADLPGTADEAQARYRSAIAGRRVLVVLDNVADTSMVADLVPGTPTAAVLVTSRRSMIRLPGARQWRLGALESESARRFLIALVGAERVEAESAAADTLIERCGRLPLALRLVGSRLADRQPWPISYLVERLADERGRLDELRCDDEAVRACFAVSIGQLLDSSAERDRRAAAAFDVLGISNGSDIGVDVAARMLQVDSDVAEDILECLTDAGLLEALAPRRYQLHDLLRTYSRERATDSMTQQQLDAALGRVLLLYRAVAWRAQQLQRPMMRRNDFSDDGWTDEAPEFASGLQALTWLDGERANLRAAVEQAVVRKVGTDGVIVGLMVGMFTYYLSRGHFRDWHALGQLARPLADAQGPRAMGLVETDLGIACAEMQWRDQARGHLEMASALARLSGDEGHLVVALNNEAHLAERMNRWDEARLITIESMDTSARIGDLSGEAIASEMLGWVMWQLGEPADSLSLMLRSLRVHQSVADAFGSASCRRRLGELNRALGNHQAALGYLRQALQFDLDEGDNSSAGELLEQIGLVHLDLHEVCSARASFERALELWGMQDEDERVARIRARLAELVRAPA